jgi:hypothetical protein
MAVGELVRRHPQQGAHGAGPQPRSSDMALLGAVEPKPARRCAHHKAAREQMTAGLLTNREAILIKVDQHLNTAGR